MKIDVLTAEGKKTEVSVELHSSVFEIEPNKSAMHQAIVGEMHHQTKGTRATKSRSEVRGGGRKPWRQKGTGRARVGSTRSPIWRGGGHTFAINPGHRRYKVNRKIRQLARRSAFSALAKNGLIKVIKRIEFESPKTGRMAELLNNLEVDGLKVLMLVSEMESNIALSARNIPNLNVVKADCASTYDLLSCDALVLEEEAADILNKTLGSSSAMDEGEEE